MLDKRLRPIGRGRFFIFKDHLPDLQVAASICVAFYVCEDVADLPMMQPVPSTSIVQSSLISYGPEPVALNGTLRLDLSRENWIE